MRFYKLLLAFLFLLSFNVFSQSSSVLKKRKDAIAKEIAILKQTRSKIDRSKKISISQISLLDAQIHLREDKISTINSEIHLLNEQILDDTRKVSSLQSELEKLKYQYSKMVQFAFKNQSAYNKLMFVFASADFNQAYKRLKYLQQFSLSRRRHAADINKTQTSLKTEISILDKNKKEKNNLLEDQQKEKLVLGSEKKSQNTVLINLTKQEKTLKHQLEKKQNEASALANAIQAAIRKEIEIERKKAIEAARIAAIKAARIAAIKAKATAAAVAANKKKSAAASVPKPVKPIVKTENVLSSGTVNLNLSSGFLANRGRLPAPVNNGIVIQRFGAQKYGKVTVYNDGINIKSAPGSAVYAVFGGEVIKAFYLINSYTVMVRHGEYFTVYSKMKNLTVSAGQKVSVKQVIGTVATDPSEGTTELQFQIWKNGSPVNPSSWLAQ